MNIGVIDSGVGGLTILFELIKEYPCNNYFYIADSKNCPYGDKTLDEIKLLTIKMVDYLVNKKHIDILVIACNTISSFMVGYLKEKHKGLIIIDTIIPTCNYVKSLNASKIGLIATSRTIESKMYNNHLPQITLITKACPEWVNIIENDVNSIKKQEVVRNDLLGLINKDIDYLLLGCTHYPLLIPYIKRVSNFKVITNTYPVILDIKKYLKKQSGKGRVEIYTTIEEVLFKNKVKSIFNKSVLVKSIVL